MKSLKIVLIILIILALSGLVSLKIVIPSMLEKEVMKFEEEHPELVLNVKNIHISWSGDVILEDILFQPAEDSVTFTRNLPFEQDWIKVGVEHMQFDLPELWAYWKYNIWVFDEIKAESLTLNVYRDKRKRDAPFRKKKLISSMLKSLPVNFRVNMLEVKNATIRYTEKKPYYLGSVWFDHVQLHMKNLTNDLGWIKTQPKMEVEANGLLNGKVAVECNYVFHLDDPTDRFEARGKIGSFKARALDETLLNLTGVHILEGQFEWITFEMHGNDSQALCNLEAEYRNLELEIRNKKNKRKSFWMSLGANLLIRDNNLKTDPDYQTGQSTFQRRQDRFLFNYQWNLIRLALFDILLIGDF